MTSPEANIGESRSYWTHNVDAFPSPVAQFRMAQLVDFDSRLYDTARTVYRFMVGWYMDDKGDALLSQRHVAKVMKQRAPEGAIIPSRNAVQRAILALMETGWVVRTFAGRGRSKASRSRYVPVANVLELASQGKFPVVAHANGPVEGSDELAHANGPQLAHANGPINAKPAHMAGHQTLLRDPGTDPGTSNSNAVAGPHAAGGLAPPTAAGFEKVWLAYGKLGSKSAAREAWAAIPDPDVDHIIARAQSWAASARPGQKRMPLERWLALEKFDEADRRVEPKPKRMPKTAFPKAANSNQPVRVVGGRTNLGTGEHLAEIIGADYADQPNGAAEIKVMLKLAGNGEERSHTYFAWHPLDDEREAGQATSRSLVRATGGDPALSDNPNPIGQQVWVIVKGSTVEYRAA